MKTKTNNTDDYKIRYIVHGRAIYDYTLPDIIVFASDTLEAQDIYRDSLAESTDPLVVGNPSNKPTFVSYTCDSVRYDVPESFHSVMDSATWHDHIYIPNTLFSESLLDEFVSEEKDPTYKNMRVKVNDNGVYIDKRAKKKKKAKK